MNLRTMVARALLDAGLSNEEVVRIGEPVAASLLEQLRRHGLALHDTRSCIRLPANQLGREMTTEEMIATGYTEGGAG